jgi:hypothetical protein
MLKRQSNPEKIVDRVRGGEVMGTQGHGTRWLFIVGILLLVGGGVAFLLTREGDEEERPEGRGTPPDGTAGVDAKDARAVKDKARRLKALMEMGRAEALREERERHAPREEAGDEAPLSPAQEAAIKETVDRLYDPAAIMEALRGERGSAGEYAREIGESFRDLTASTTLDGPDGPVPVSAEVKMALDRANALRSYTLNLMHAHRPDNLDRQWEMVRRVNDQFRSRIDTLNELYPFLGVRMVEAP